MEEAARRGLPNAPDTPSALEAFAKPENAALFEKYGVMTARELRSRHEILLEDYAKKIRIEGACARDIAAEMIVPAVKAEFLETAQALSAAGAVEVSSGTSALRTELVVLGKGLDDLKENIADLNIALDDDNTEEIVSNALSLRTAADALERIVSSARWPLPKYRDMLFLY